MRARRFFSMCIRSYASLNTSFIIHNHIKSITVRKIFDWMLIPFGMCKLIVLNLKKMDTSNFKYNLSIVCILKNESTYIREWIIYHHSIGVEHFYLYDNDSDDNLIKVLSEFQDIITYIPIHGQLRQLDAYNNALSKYRNDTRYMAMIDADEFLYCPDMNQSIDKLLSNIFSKKNIGGLVVNWVVFGSSKYDKRPKGRVTDNFIWRSKIDFEKNHLVKTICDPRRVFSFTVSHAANYLRSYHAVDENGKKVEWVLNSQVTVKKIRINHYYSKSKEEFMKKRARGSGESLALRHLSEFNEHDKNDVFDDSLRKYNLKKL